MAAITTYGERSSHAPGERKTFAFLVGKWTGTGRTRLPDGNYAQWEGATWIGRYILDGMAIADEFHAPAPDGKPYLGISLRQYDAKRGTWIIEYLNVSYSFLRRQVGPQGGSVSGDTNAVIVISEDGPMRIRELYRVSAHDHFTYSTDKSEDGGKTWSPPLVEMTMKRAE